MKPMILATALAVVSAGSWAATADEALNKVGCMACHQKDKKLIGPAFKDIAAKYKGQDATTTLMDKVRKGGSGVYGPIPIPMPPNGPDKINDADLKLVVESILKG